MRFKCASLHAGQVSHQCLQKPANPKTNKTEIRQNFCRQMFYFIKHYISFWNQNSKALKFTLCMSQSAPELNRTKQLSDILPCKLNSCLKRKNLISSIFCFPIDNKHRPSGLNLCLSMMQECHLNAMFTYMYVDKPSK